MSQCGGWALRGLGWRSVEGSVCFCCLFAAQLRRWFPHGCKFLDTPPTGKWVSSLPANTGPRVADFQPAGSGRGDAVGLLGLGWER